MQEFFDSYPVLSKLALGFGGMLAGVAGTIVQNRRPLLTYSVSHTQIGMSANDEVHGQVEVRYQGNVVQNLYLSVIEIRNRSIRDLENLDIKTFRGIANMAMLTEQSVIESSIEPVRLTQDYLNRIATDSEWEQAVREAGTDREPENAQRLARDFDFRTGQRHYLIPVLNRGQVARITYLTALGANPGGPAIWMTCQSKGVRVKHKPYPQATTHLLGVPLQHAGIAGLFVGTIIAIGFASQVAAHWIVASGCYLIGAFASVPGAATLRAYDWVRAKLIG
ncbi:MAG: hypothetical protein RIB46_13570 [Pseudomonadales bacterium]